MMLLGTEVKYIESISPVVRTIKQQNTRSNTINPDTPMTIEACMELGINPDDLIQK